LFIILRLVLNALFFTQSSNYNYCGGEFARLRFLFLIDRKFAFTAIFLIFIIITIFLIIIIIIIIIPAFALQSSHGHPQATSKADEFVSVRVCLYGRPTRILSRCIYYIYVQTSQSQSVRWKDVDNDNNDNNNNNNNNSNNNNNNNNAAFPGPQTANIQKIDNNNDNPADDKNCTEQPKKPFLPPDENEFPAPNPDALLPAASAEVDIM
jgi:hypothetical protein